MSAISDSIRIHQTNEVSTPTLPVGVFIKAKIAETVDSIRKEVESTFLQHKEMNHETFVATQITPRLEALEKFEIDERIATLITKMMQAVNLAIELPAWIAVYSLFTPLAANEEVRKDLVKVIAYPQISALAADFDEIDSFIVDNINSVVIETAAV